MLDPLLPAYERELDAFRTLAADFAERFPRVAQALRPVPDSCQDPHVERLIEAFALLAARIHRKLDDGYPDLVEAFVQVLYPHYTRPIPAATIVQLALAPDRPDGRQRCTLPRHTALLAPETRGVRCAFRTTQELDLWPLTVAHAALERPPLEAPAGAPAAVLTLDLATWPGLAFPALDLDQLRFFLDGEPPLMHMLHELLLCRVQEVRLADPLADPPTWVTLPASAIGPVGFDRDQALWEWDERCFQGGRLLAEYFTFPDKFLFFQLTGLRGGPPRLGGRLRVQVLLSRFGATERHLRLLRTLSAAQIRLGCVPAVNLFRRPGVPIPVTHRQPSYPVVPADPPQVCDVHSIDAVWRTTQGASGTRTHEVPAFCALRHGARDGEPTLYWYAGRAPAGDRRESAARMELTLVDADFRAVRPARETLSLQLTCSNRNLPDSIPFGGGAAQEDFKVPGHPQVGQARLLRKPTPSLDPLPKRELQWRLISHLALNRLSLAAHDRAALRELLELYRFSDAPGLARQIQGIHRIRAEPGSAWIPGRGPALVLGTEITVTFDESCYVGSNLYLFATVLERLFGHLCGPNSFTRFRMSTCQQRDEVAQWPPRNGEATLT